MKHTIFIIFFILFIFNFIFAEDLVKAIENAKIDLDEIIKENKNLIKKISDEREQLERQKSELKLKFEKLFDEEQKIRNKNKNLEALKNELEKKISEKNYEIIEFKNIINERINDLYTELLVYSTAPDNFDDLQILKNFLISNIQPNSENLKIIFNILLNEIKRGSQIIKFQGKFFNKEGKEDIGEIIRFGKIFAIFKNDNKFGFLGYSSSTNSFFELPIKLNSKFYKYIKKYFEEEKEIKYLPIDISGGNAIEIIKNKKNLIEHIKSGGIIVYPIILIGILAVFIIIERIIKLNKYLKTNELIFKRINNLLDNQNELENFLKEANDNIFFKITKTILNNKEKDKKTIEELVEEKIMYELPELEKYLSTLNMFGAISPLLGLLGTVTGIITTFDIITIFGTGNPKLLSGGISEALVTTELGLIIAIPVLLAHNFLTNKVSKIINFIEKNSNNILNNLLSQYENK
ncbi:MAG TPA: MotA/TolQ/ExbB proton channel family protein [bacterium]|nr:MotA/TolQ/ExbB proton channel family protein [bacterium]HOL48418.1 MotA/TolQ/ExbB proton channel family protein [bacterium]HPQ19459.1 MotA/TolQ/ExbB proton channel family protein [bacterium]